MGYGSRALELLADYYQGRIPNISEDEGESHVLRNTAVRCVSARNTTKTMFPCQEII